MYHVDSMYQYSEAFKLRELLVRLSFLSPLWAYNKRVCCQKSERSVQCKE